MKSFFFTLIPHCDLTRGGGATKKIYIYQMCPSSPGQFRNIDNNTEIGV